MSTPVYPEIGSSKTFACSPAWPCARHAPDHAWEMHTAPSPESPHQAGSRAKMG